MVYQILSLHNSIHHINWFQAVYNLFNYICDYHNNYAEAHLIYTATPLSTWWLQITRHQADARPSATTMLLGLFCSATWTLPNIVHHIDGLVQDRRNSIANTLELHLSCTKPLNNYNALHPLTHWVLVTVKLTGKGTMASYYHPSPSHYLNQCWLIHVSQMEPLEQTSAKIESNTTFLFKKIHIKCCLQKCQPFCLDLKQNFYASERLKLESSAACWLFWYWQVCLLKVKIF